jgi:uncharacterized repeat protein (TIGR02543 family)
MADTTAFSIRFGTIYKDENGPIITTTPVSLNYVKTDRPSWEFNLRNTYGNGWETPVFQICGIDDGITTNSVGLYAAGYVGAYNLSNATANTGSGSITGVSYEFYCNGINSPRPNYNTIILQAYRDPATGVYPAWCTYNVQFVIKDMKGTIEVGDDTIDTTVATLYTPSASGNTQNLTLSLPATLTENQYIDKIIVTPMGTSGTSVGELSSRNGIDLYYMIKSWTGQRWPDGSTVGPNNVIPMSWKLTYINNPSAATNPGAVLTFQGGTAYLVYSNATDAQATMVSTDSTELAPGDLTHYTIRGITNAYRARYGWKNPRVVVRVPNQLELVGNTFTLTNLAGTPAVTSATVHASKVGADSNYNYYSFQSDPEDNYTAPIVGFQTAVFSISVTFRVMDGAVAGHYGDSTGKNRPFRVLTSSSDAENFSLARFDPISFTTYMNNLPANELADKSKYGFGTNDNYAYIGGATAFEIVPSVQVGVSTAMQSNSTGGWVSSAVAPAANNEAVQIKLSLTNTGNVPIDNLRIYDILPALGDNLNSTGTVTFEDMVLTDGDGATLTLPGITSRYSTDSYADLAKYGAHGGGPIDLETVTFTSGANWSASASSATTAFLLNFGSNALAPNETWNITLSLKIPASGSQTVLNQFDYTFTEQGKPEGKPFVSNISTFSTEYISIAYNDNTSAITSYPLGDPVDYLLGLPDTVTAIKGATGGGVGKNQLTVTTDEPTLPGYTFSGWNTQSNGEGTNVSASEVHAFTAAGIWNLYAKWTKNTITINYDTNVPLPALYPPDVFVPALGSDTAQYGGFVGSTTTSAGVIPPGSPTRTGYDFKGWFETKEKADDWSNNTAWNFQSSTVINPSSGTKTLYAAWEIKKFTINFVAGEGAASSVNGSWINVLYGTSWQDAVSAAGAVPTEESLNIHYINPVWSTTLPVGTDLITATKTYTLNYSLDSHTVIYVDNFRDGGSVPNPDTKIHGQTVTIPGQGNMLRAGYTFLGWDENASAITPTHTAGSTIESIDADYTLYTIWIADNYRLIYNQNTTDVTIGSVPSDATNYHITETQTLSDNGTLERPGYTFAGWGATTDATSPISSVTFGSVPFALGNITVYAIWNVNSYPYTITHHFVGGSKDGTQTLVTSEQKQFGQSVAAGTAATYTGYSLDATHPSAVHSGVIGVSGLALHLYYQANSYTVSYAAGGNNVTGLPSGATQYMDDSYTVSNRIPVRAGYTFNGWVATSGISGNYSGGNVFTMPASNVVLTASWTLNEVATPTTFTVSYNGGGDNVTGLPSGATALKEGDSYTISGNIPVRDGYTFIGWIMTSGGSGSYNGGDSFTMPASDVVLTASWEEVIAEPSAPTESTEQTNTPSKTEAKLAAQTGNPIVDLFRGNVPLGNVRFEGAWSLLSMLMSLVAVVTAVLLVLGAIVRRRDEDEIAGQARGDAEGDYRRRGKILKVLTIIVGILTPVVWIVLDTLNQQVVWINKFTVYVGIAFVATVVLLVLYKVRKGDEKREAAEV